MAKADTAIHFMHTATKSFSCFGRWRNQNFPQIPRGTNRNEVSEELIQFLEYMEQSTLNVAIPDTNRNLIKIHNHVRQVKASEEIGVKFMQ